MSCPPALQFVFKTESFTASTSRLVHEELAKAMTAILKPSTDFLTSNKLLKVRGRRAAHCSWGRTALCSPPERTGSVPGAELQDG
jgi:hypothetical protein